MAIDINSINPSAPRPSGDRQASDRLENNAPSGQNNDQQNQQSNTGDTIHLTDRVASLQKLQNTIEKLPVLDTEKVVEMKQAIKSGSFEIDVDNIAEKIMDFEKDLFGPEK